MTKKEVDKVVDVLFEASWEVCNKVGGIFTVVKSKAACILNHYGEEDYFLIGPYFEEQARGQFEVKNPPESFSNAVKELADRGIIIHFGKWLIGGQPNTILIDFKNFLGNSDGIKGELWDAFKVDSLGAGYEYSEPVTWSWVSGIVIEKLAPCFNDKRIVAHFHEWLSGAGLLYLKKVNAPVATVFTTHATILGRTLASSDVELYENLEKFNAEEEARRYGIAPKFTLEKQSALNADVFTTVSEITGIEAEHLLGRKPDVLLPNGLDMNQFPSFEDSSVSHKLRRDQIKEFILSYFFSCYKFDMNKVLIYFLVGRYEFRDKGIDVYIDALAKLNQQLIEDNSDQTVVAFIWVPASVGHIRESVVRGKVLFKDVKDVIEDNMRTIRRNILYALTKEERPELQEVIPEKLLLEIKKRMMRLKCEGNVPLSTHEIFNEGNDQIVRRLREVGLTNTEENRVKVIFYPIYLSGADGILDLSYYECMQGTHLGIFPSYYEPWGYTPLEAAALGVPSVTTDLAGFGRYLEQQGKSDGGIHVIKRMGKSYDDVVNQMAEYLVNFTSLSKQQRVDAKIAAKRLSYSADWKILIEHYFEAHNMASEKKNQA